MRLARKRGVKKDHTWGRGPSEGDWSNTEFRRRRHYMKEYQLCLVVLMK